MARARVDFHIHTNCSDGAKSPKEIIDIAKQNGVIAMSIADHDTIEAYTDELIDYAKEKGVELIPAVEMSTSFYKVGIHVLGYSFDRTNKELLETLSLLKNARRDYLVNVAKALGKIGYYIDVEKLQELPTVTKAHIALDAVSQECNKELLLKEFGDIPGKGMFIETIMNEGCPAYVEKFHISPVEASRIIHGAGGKVVLAHPVAYAHEDGLSEEQVENLVAEMGADGVESYYIYADRNDEVFDECDKWGRLADKLGKFKTVGSDFHVSDGIRPEVGFINTNLELSEDEMQQIVKNLKK